MKRLMMFMMCVWLLLLSGCQPTAATDPPVLSEPLPEETAFVKAAWVPYMEVEEWLQSGDPNECSRAIAAAMEDCRHRGINTVYLHVRANSDAYYASAVYPRRPSAEALLSQGVDPLQLAVEEAHARDIALHAWINPYRIGADRTYAVNEAVFEADGRWYYDPTAPSTHTLIVQGIKEIVERYDIDGVQFDDYFYLENAVPSDAPAAFEAEAYTAYTDGGGALDIGTWRRGKVSALVAAVYTVCHQREGCVFGISPAYDIAQNRDRKYADVERWIGTAGFVDYLCPQLYFGFSHQSAPFLRCFEEWNALPRDESVGLIAGLAAYKTGLAEDPYAGSGAAEWYQREDILARQATLAGEAAWDGIALYSHRSFTAEDGRDAAIVEAELRGLCEVWAKF